MSWIRSTRDHCLEPRLLHFRSGLRIADRSAFSHHSSSKSCRRRAARAASSLTWWSAGERHGTLRALSCSAQGLLVPSIALPRRAERPDRSRLWRQSGAKSRTGFPQFLPDGHRFIYFATSCRPGESSIRVGSLDSATSTPIVESETSALYAPVFRGRSGCLLFVSHNAMLAQPLDLPTLERRGRPEIVAPEVRYRRWGQASMSISNDGLLLYRGGTDENHQFTWIGRQGATIATVGPRNRANYWFDLSPDGKRVAIHRLDDPDTALPTIWVMDLYRGGTLWRFTEPGGQDSDFCPVWDANGAELVFSRGDDRSMRVLRRPLSGGTPISIVDTKGPKFPTDWSDDGGYVAYNSQEPDYRYQHLWIASMNGESRLFLPQTYYAGSARFAPAVVDGRPRWLAYTSNETGRYEIYIRSFPDAAHMFQISNKGGVMPQWRRDGRELFYIDLDGTLTAVGMDLEAAEFGTPRRLVRDGSPPDPVQHVEEPVRGCDRWAELSVESSR